MASSNHDPDAPTVYRVEYTDAAKEEIERTYLWRSASTSPEAAARWAEELRARVDKLALFPYRNERAPEYLQSGGAVRRMLFGVYRVLYLVIKPEESNEPGVVRVLHVYHGARWTGESRDLDPPS